MIDQMIPILLAKLRESLSELSLIYTFFYPKGVIKVLIDLILVA